MPRYHVVCFEVDGTAAVVPDTWMINDELCYWPPYKGQKKVDLLVKTCSTPDALWEKLKVRDMYSTDSYSKAKLKEDKCLDTSDLASEAEVKILKKKKRRRIEETSSEDESSKFFKKTPTLKAPTIKSSFNKSTKLIKVSTSIPDMSVHQLTVPQMSIPQLPEPQMSVPRTSGFQLTEPPMPIPETSTPKSSCSDCRSHTDRQNGFQKKVFKMFEQLRGELKELKEMFQTSKHSLPKLPSTCPAFPMQNPETVVELEVYLKDEKFFSDVCEYLSTIGGTDVKDCTRRVLSKIISNSLSLNYNWKGTRGVKLAFSTYICINRLILGVVRKNFADATEVNVQNVTKNWLMHARDRDGGRGERIQSSLNNINNNVTNEELSEE